MEQAKRVEDILFAVNTTITCVGMLGVGATVDYRVVIKYLKSPNAYIVGVLTQLLLVPLLAWGITEMFRMDQDRQLSVMIQGCSPGGSTSNVVVYWMGGVVDLSVAMTGTTTILALGMMPFWLFVFSKVSNLPNELLIPFDSLGITLGSLLPPILLGMILNAKAPERFTVILSKICIAFGSIGIVVVTIVGTFVRNLTWIITWKLVMVSVLMPLLGFALGYLMTLFPFLGLKRRVSRTVATEVALQNAQVCSAVIQSSFATNRPILGKMVVFPLLYYIFQVGYSLIFVGLYKFLKSKGHFADEDAEIEEEKAMARNGGVAPDETFENKHAKELELPSISYQEKNTMDNSYTRQIRL